VSISYDRVPEEQSLLRELRGYAKEKMLLRALLQWTARMARGEVQLGRMHIRCGEALMLDQHTDVTDLSQMIMAQLQGNTVATTYHLRCFVHMHGQAGFDVTWLREAIERRGGIVLDSPMAPKAGIVLDPLLERCLRHHWLHLFFGEALAAQPNNPALQHYVAENGYAQAHVDSPSALADMRVQRLSFHLLEPVCADYAAVARTVKRYMGRGGMVTGEQLLRHTAYKDYVTAQAGLRALVARGYLTAVANKRDTYQVQARAGELDGYIERCAWKVPKALQSGAWARAVGT
ncbi:MAG TPA: hypothetical protein VFH51_20755, partial [Myxococcota bacterium]|nr:hypothetical protein [Myxococcota bacterium]